MGITIFVLHLHHFMNCQEFRTLRSSNNKVLITYFSCVETCNGGFFKFRFCVMILLVIMFFQVLAQKVFFNFVKFQSLVTEYLVKDVVK